MRTVRLRTPDPSVHLNGRKLPEPPSVTPHRNTFKEIMNTTTHETQLRRLTPQNEVNRLFDDSFIRDRSAHADLASLGAGRGYLRNRD